ncbi:unnamed protein product [Schistosoma margrebowiei]|uniref:DUF1907 domain-containing protein n=1 Tax=Schistosoma margrebowiei TaxID=48269 RepID=A0AA85ANI4_9TREM|nr:unnamed protein product [Schistosoma margrebowiei]
MSLFELHKPSLLEVSSALESHLKNCFETVKCSIIDCPDLTSSPYGLTLRGLGGKGIICDVGSFDYLLPVPKKDRHYDLLDVFRSAGVAAGAVIGAGAGPFFLTGSNSEMVINISSESGVVKNGSLFGLYDQENNKPLLTKADNTKFALLGQMFMCEGKPGPVIELNVSGRIQDGKFDAMIREALHIKYGHLNNAVGLGGVIVQEKGKSLYHVLPEFSQEPIDSGEKLRNWIKMFEMESPVISVGIAVSHDPHHLGLRLEHFHCFNQDQTNCGHCHFDTYGPTVSYRCYFSIANHLLRIDQPSKSL